jgi:hypothetical protein
MACTIRHSTNARSHSFRCVGRIVGVVHMRSCVIARCVPQHSSIAVELVTENTGFCRSSETLRHRDLALIAHTKKCIWAPNQRKLLCCNDFLAIRGRPDDDRL